jgi:hypothetical protein
MAVKVEGVLQKAAYDRCGIRGAWSALGEHLTERYEST